MRKVWFMRAGIFAGRESIHAYTVKGGLAVHAMPDRKEGYSVTHLNTGLAVRQYIPSLALARKIMKALIHSDVPWARIETKEQAGRYYHQAMALIRAVEDPCGTEDQSR